MSEVKTSQFDLLRVHEVAELLRCSVMTVQRICKRGELRKVKIGRGVRFRRKDVERFIEACARKG